MVRWMRKAQVAPGKFIEAMGFANEIAQFVKKFEGIPPVSSQSGHDHAAERSHTDRDWPDSAPCQP